MKVSSEIKRNAEIDGVDGEIFALVVTTYHEGAVATTAVHRQDFERRIGGARFKKNADPSEVGHLASRMTDKCMACMIPADGQKSVIVTGPVDSLTDDWRAAILVEHVRVVRELDSGIIVGPDMDSSESVQDRASRAEGLLDHFTGLSNANNGLSIDGNGYTAHGLVAAVRAAVDEGALVEQRVSIQGFGAVGAHAARMLGDLGTRIVAVCNKDVLLVDQNGLDVSAMFAYFQEHGDAGLLLYASEAKGVHVSDIPDEIFEVPTDIFLPAGPIDALAMGDELEHVRIENPSVRDVVKFHEATGVSLVVEGANRPLSPAAERWLESQGVRILPDFIVNCGGLIGCWFEWEARHRDLLHPVIDLQRVGEDALERISATVTENVKEILASKLAARDAAEQIVQRKRTILLAERRV